MGSVGRSGVNGVSRAIGDAVVLLYILAMARQPRVEFPGAFYHVVARSIERRAIFRDVRDRSRYLELLAERVERFGVRLFAHCLMGNYVHLAVERAARQGGSGRRWCGRSVISKRGSPPTSGFAERSTASRRG